MPLSCPAISHHLKVLRTAGLVQMERVSRENFYSLSVGNALATLRLFVEQAEVSCTKVLYFHRQRALRWLAIWRSQ